MDYFVDIRDKKIPICCLANKKDIPNSLSDVQVNYMYIY